MMSYEENKPEKPDPKIPGGSQVTFKHGKPTKIELTVKHFVDDWFETGFRFRVSKGVARLEGIDSPGEYYYWRQNKPAREKAYDTVAELPFITEVKRLND